MMEALLQASTPLPEQSDHSRCCSLHMDFIGIDFGAKTAGTTVICQQEGGFFRFHRCEKGDDADAWLDERVSMFAPSAIYIDAPLSLPGAYFGKGQDYFYRSADRLAGGMSPMFLGGLTARAIRLAERWGAGGTRKRAMVYWVRTTVASLVLGWHRGPSLRERYTMK